ncbi:MAG: Holliday junction branch migration protein RuvA, partial [Gammaproteobacteria bacterium]
TLLKVNGVGTKMALVILSGMDPNAFADCVHSGDTARLTALPGVGKKTAERLIIEMRDRVAQPDTVSISSVPVANAGDPANDAISGLIALGYKPAEASKFVHGMDTDGLTSEQIIREVLKNLLPQ